MLYTQIGYCHKQRTAQKKQYIGSVTQMYSNKDIQSKNKKQNKNKDMKVKMSPTLLENLIITLNSKYNYWYDRVTRTILPERLGKT